MDTIFIKGLSLSTRIGVYAEEQGRHQKLIVDLDLGLSENTSGKTDALAETLDYASLSLALTEWSALQDCDLLEKFAEDMCAFVFLRYSLCQKIVLTVHKPPAAQALGLLDVGLKIERQRA